MQYYLLYFSLIYVLIYHELESKKTWLFYTPMWRSGLELGVGRGPGRPNSNSMQRLRLRERRSRQERDESSNHRAPPP